MTLSRTLDESAKYVGTTRSSVNRYAVHPSISDGTMTMIIPGLKRHTDLCTPKALAYAKAWARTWDEDRLEELRDIERQVVALIKTLKYWKSFAFLGPQVVRLQDILRDTYARLRELKAKVKARLKSLDWNSAAATIRLMMCRDEGMPEKLRHLKLHVVLLKKCLGNIFAYLREQM